MVNQTSEHLFKVLIVGQASTGKTSFVKRYVHQFFSRHYKATIGVDFALKTLQFNENTTVRLQLWDIAGQDRFNSMTRVYYRDAVGAFLVFDASKPRLEPVIGWKRELDAKVSLSDGSTIPCLLLANKCDLVERTREEEEELKEFAKKHGFIGYLYTSPKDNINVEQAAKVLVMEIMRRQQDLSNFDGPDQSVGRRHNGSIVMRDFDETTRAYRQNENRSSCCG